MSELFPELDAYERVDAEAEGEADSPRRSWSAETRALFDQLVGASPGADEAGTDEAQGEGEQPVYEEHVARLFGPGLAAGAESLARFEQAFGLVGKIRSLKRTEAGTLDFVAEVDEAGTLACGFLGPADARGWKQGKSFTLGYTGELHPVVARALMRFLARYDGAPFELILDQVVPDAGDEHMLASDYPESLFYAYAPASGWRRFFEGTELYRGTCGRHTGKVAVIDHTDIECLFNQAPASDRLPDFFNTPAVALPEDDHYEGGPRPPAWSSQALFTDIGDVDVIKGADVLVDEALLHIAALDEQPDSIVIQAGCLPEVTGDDLEASAARTRDRLRLPVIAAGQHNDIAGSSFGEMIGDRQFELERELDPRRVTILGMPAFVGRDELLDLLGDAGVRVEVVFPEIPDRAIDALERSSLIVTYPWDRYEVTSRRLSERLAPARTLQLRPPFGFEASRRWLLSVAAALGRRAELEARLGEYTAQLRPRWRLLQSRARQLRLGFVIEHGNWRAALAAKRSLGLPMLELLSEMGFGVDVLAYAGDRPKPPAAERFDGIEVRWYRDVDELDGLLADPRVAAWYSELYFDRRLSRNGKNVFSMRQLNMGLSGAIDSLEAVLRLANMSFYRSYARYLGPAFVERGRS